MDLTKRYQDEDGNPRNILEMVGQFPEWAANRIQEGEKAASQISALEAKCRDLEKRLNGIIVKRVQPCGCVMCICDDDVKCHGCGAKMCDNTDCDVRRGTPAYDKHPRIDELEQQLAAMTEERDSESRWVRGDLKLNKKISL